MRRRQSVRRHRGIEVKRLAALLLLATAACGREATEPTEPPVQEPADITSRVPDSGTGDVSTGTTIRIVFGWPVVLPFYPENTIWLEHGGVRVDATLTCPDSQTVELEPVDILEFGTDYTVHVGPGVIRPGGLIAPTQWSFETGGRPFPAMDAARLLAQVSALADDSMKGRGSGSADELKAAGYIQAEFERYGLVPYADHEWMQPVPGPSQNVIGIVPGNGGLADQWVIVGAHYDHVGIRDGLIYNGADDNASGTAGVLELARTLAQHAAEGGFGGNDRRSLMFIAFGAEEIGLEGSCTFARAPFMPVSTITAMLNLDMIGRMRNDSLEVDGRGADEDWAVLLERYHGALQYRSMLHNSDHLCFWTRAGRPALMLTTGRHAQYHTPEDDTQLINAPGMAAIATLALDLVVNLALRPRELTR